MTECAVTGKFVAPTLASLNPTMKFFTTSAGFARITPSFGAKMILTKAMEEEALHDPKERENAVNEILTDPKRMAIIPKLHMFA